MAKKGTRPCINCDRPVGFFINFEQPKHEHPILFCSLKCFKEFARKPRHGGIRLVKGTVEEVEGKVLKESEKIDKY